jgi:pyrroloquinoline quinone biosynthesis protein B
MRRPIPAILAASCLLGLASGAEAPGPCIVVLGSAQDGGLPHASCACPRCDGARKSPRRLRAVASLALVSPAEERAWLVDATPDLPAQLERLRVARGRPAGAIDRAPVDGVLLTHAHFGHVTGLGFLGFEAVHTREIPLHCTEALAAHLSANAPWADLVRRRNVVLVPFRPGEAVRLAPDITVVPFLVPHRDEHADTVGLRIEGPRATVLYVPDTDGWDRWDPPLERRLDGVTVALLDGTFFSVDELPDRGTRSIGHPPIRQTMERLGARDPRTAPRIVFTHLNHSNPAVDPRSPAAREIRRAGYAVVADGETIGL